jgi:hypothetical protein
MTLSDLMQVADNYSNARYGPIQMGVSFGCDCGCGGYSYTEEEWDDEIEQNEQAVKAMKNLCATLGITYDGI